jgi:hypothetical protein
MGISFNGRIRPTGRVRAGIVPPPLVWTTAAGSLGLYADADAVSAQLEATGPGAITYTLVDGTLPGGVTLAANGLISGPVTAAGTLSVYAFTVRATAGQHTADRTFSLSVAALPNDPYFDQTVLLMPMEGSNGSARLLDESQTGRTVTVNGTTKLSTQVSKMGTAAVDFASGDNIYYSNADGAFTFGTDDFTVEFWFNARSVSGNFSMATTAAVSDQNGFWIGVSAGQIYWLYGNGAWVGSEVIGSVSANTWYHVSLTRQGTTLRLFLNGSLLSTKTNVTTSLTAGAQMSFGGRSIASQWYSGYIDDARIYRGVAKYTAAFTPATTAMPVGTEDPNWPSCILATPFETSLKDYAGRRPYTVAGNAQLSTAEKKYGTSSLRLDGTGDFVLYPDHADFDFGSGDFTIETWVRLDGLTNQQAIVSKRTNDTVGTPFLIWCQSGVIRGRLTTTVTDYTISITTGPASITAGNWFHVALVRSGSTLRLTVNGTTTTTGNVGTAAVITNTARLCIGANAEDGSTAMAGYLDGFRVTRAARYSAAAFTPSRASTVRDETVDMFAASTVLKLHMDGADQATTFADDSLIGKTVTAAGNAAITAARANFGTSSAAFDGSGDYLSYADPALESNFGADDFTIEMWLHPTAIPSSGHAVLFSKRSNSTQARHVFVSLRPGGQIAVYASGNNTSWNLIEGWPVSAGIVAGQWQHVALTRQGTTWRVFVNGVVKDTRTGVIGTVSATTSPILIGSDTDTFGFTGSIQDYRIYRGAAKYTADFTPPSALQGLGSTNDANWSKCILATPMTADINDYAGKRVTADGSAKLTTATKKFGTAALDLDTLAASKVVVADQPALELGSGDFTAEMWFRTSAAAGQAKLLLDKRAETTGSASPLVIQVNSDQMQVLSGVGTGWAVNATLPRIRIGDWVHVAVTRQGSVYRAFINGVRVLEQTNVTGSLTDNATGWIVGGSYTAANAGLNGQIDDFRLTKACRYSVNFEPPTRAAA